MMGRRIIIVSRRDRAVVPSYAEGSSRRRRVHGDGRREGGVREREGEPARGHEEASGVVVRRAAGRE